jgi:signal transduction histidine kinase/CheY-like chemotaxis protein
VHGAGIRTRAGDLYFPGMEGLVRVARSHEDGGQRGPRVSVEEVVSGGQVFRPENGVIQLPSGRRDLEIRFTGLSFRNPQAMVFRYRLGGAESQWQGGVRRRSAFYTNLSGGRYRFEVEASTGPGVWSDHPAVLDVVVPYRAHEHPVLQAGLGVFLLMGLFGVIRWREARLRWQARQLEVLVGERTRVVESQASRLLEMDRIKSRLFEDISHELRTPLTLVLAPLEDLREELAGTLTPVAHRNIEVATLSAQRLLELVGQILELARLEAGRLPVRVHRMAAGPWIEHQALAFAPLAEAKGIRLHVGIAPDLPELWSSPDLLQKMLGNLIANAIKFTPEGGVVRIRASAEDDFHRIEVRDSGPGISPERIEALFQRFSGSWGDAGESMGEGDLPSTKIGLSLARQLAEFHGGDIDVASEEGFGSTFTLRLRLGTGHFPDDVDLDPSMTFDVGFGAAPVPVPVPAPLPQRERLPVEPRPSHPDAGTAEDGAGSNRERPAILIVEDHPDVRAYLQVLLGDRYAVALAENGRAALELIPSVEPDLIMSDLRMPELDGMGLLAAVRARDQRRADGLTTPFLLVSAREDPMDRASAYGMGVSDFISKPFVPKDLLARIEGLLATQTALRKRRPTYQVTPAPVDVPSQTVAFLNRVARVAGERMSDPSLGTTQLAATLGYSRSGLYRKLEEVGESSPAQLLQRMRLDRAVQLLRNDAGSVGRVAARCGFRSVSHFSRAFKARFGVPPSQFVDDSSTGTER